MAKEKLKDVLEEKAVKAKINNEEASVLALLCMAQIEHSEKARKALVVYLEGVLAGETISDDQARAAHNILRQVSVSTHRRLCDRVISKYLSKFDKLLPAPEPEAKQDKKQPAAA